MAARDNAPDAGQGAAGTGQVLLVLLVTLVPLVSMAMMQLALPVLAPMITREGGLTPEAVGWITGASGLGSVWFYAANHAVTPVLGPLRSLQVATLLSLAGAVLVLTGSWPAQLAGAVAIGFAYSVTTPAGSQILAAEAPRQHWGKLFSLRQAGVPLGGVIAGTVGAALAVEHGWRAALIGLSAICLVLGIGLLLAPPRYNGKGPRPAWDHTQLFALSNIRRPFDSVRGTPGLPRLLAASMGFAVVQGATVSFFVTYVTAGLGLSLAVAGLLFGVMQASSVAGRVLFGFLADLLGSMRRTLIILALLSFLASMTLAVMSGEWSLPVLLATAVFVGLSVATWNGLYLAEVAVLAKPDRVAEVTAGSTFFVFFTYMVTPPLFGLLALFAGYRSAFVVAGIAALIAAALLLTAGSAPAEQKRDS